MSDGVPVTDHAVLRYMERAMGLDVERVREEIARKVEAAGERQKVGLVPVDGYLFQIRDYCVVTVLYARFPKARARRRRGELPEDDPRNPGAQPPSDDDPWWYYLARGG